ncbi:hypothetical protein QEN19_000580 [Hanseniaspora menglaensis]
MTYAGGSRRSFDEMMQSQYGDQHKLQFTSSSEKVKLKEVNYDKYKPGNIISIELYNMMVYTRGRFVFDSNLNMILGANGSGKSTVLCAINIVLDGNLSNIGRASEMDHFIKKDCDQGEVSITLKSDYALLLKMFSNTELAYFKITQNSKTVQITRRIFRHNQKNNKKHEYYINGTKLATDTAVKLLVKCFNIQLDNLTQFLSQERAREFSNLSQKDLFKTTLKSISLETYNEWNSLSEVESKKNRLSEVIHEQQKKLDDLSEEKSVLEAKVQENAKYSTLKKEIKQYENLLTLVKYNEIKKGTQKAEEAYAKCQQAFDEKNIELQQVLKSEKVYSKIKDKVINDISKAEKEALLYTNSLKFNNLEVNNLKKKAEDEIASLKHFDSIKEKYLSECQKYQQAIVDIDNQISEFKIEDPSSYAECKDQRLKLGSNRRNLDAEIQEHANIVASLHRKKTAAENQIRTLQNSLNGKDPLMKLSEDDQRRFRSALDAAKKQGLDDAVLMPAIACLEVSDDRYADFINAAISKNTALAITFTNSNAKDRLGEYIASNLGLNTFQLDYRPTQNSPIPIDQLRRFGFDGYAADFLKGDENVKKMVIDKNKLNQTPVSMSDLDQSMIENLKKLVDKNGKLVFTQVLAGKSSYRFITSKYDGRVTVSSFTIQPGRNFRKTGNIISDELRLQTESSIQNIEQTIKKIKEQILEMDNTMNAKRIQLARIDENGKLIIDRIKKYEIQFKTYNDLRMQKNRYETSLEKAQNKVSEFSDEKTKDMKVTVIKNIFSFKINQSLASMNPISYLSKGATESLYKRQKKKLVLQSLENEQLLNKYETSTLQIKLNDLESQVNASKELMMEANNDDTRKLLKQKVDSFDKTTMRKLKKLCTLFDPLTVNSVANVLRSKNSDLQGLHFDNASEDKLQQINTGIEKIKVSLPKLLDEYNKATTDFEARDGVLKSVVESTIHGISEKFESLFGNVGNQGKVTLSDLNQPYKQWEIEIQVSFRSNTNMQKLSGKTHSGGEQSVSTMLYLISLQRYTKAPFTVIDEINQGMDANNERKIHEILVKETCSSHDHEGSQYILITPKLLTNLYYDYGMQCNIIFAGLEMPEVRNDESLLNLGAATLFDLEENS